MTKNKTAYCEHAAERKILSMAAREKRKEIMIINRRTGKALQSSGPDSGQVVEQSEPTGSDAQLWTPVKVGRSNIKLVNKQSGKLLDVTHGSTEAGSWAQIWEDVGGESQLWKWVKVTATYRKLMNVQSGKVLDIVEMREDDGAPAQIWDDVEGAGQQWKLVDAPAEEPAPKKKITRRPRKPKAVQEVPEAEVKAEPAAEDPAPVEEAPKPAPKKRGRKPKAAKAEAPAEAPKTPAKRRGRKPKAEK